MPIQLTRAERARRIGAILNPEDENADLTLREVADATNRDIRVIRNFVKKGKLPAKKNDHGEYLVKATHVGIVLWLPAWGEKTRLNRRKGLKRTVLPGSTPGPDTILA